MSNIGSSLHEHCILKVTDLIAHMSTSMRPSSSVAKPTQHQKFTSTTTIDTASEPSSGVDKPTDAENWTPSVRLKNLTDALSCRAHEATVKNLLSATTNLREWQTAVSPTHKQRDAMTKLGSDWHVPQKTCGKKRTPIEVAKGLEEQFIETAQRMLEKRTPFGYKRGADDDSAIVYSAPSNKAARFPAMPPNENECASLEEQGRGSVSRHLNRNLLVEFCDAGLITQLRTQFSNLSFPAFW